MTMTDYGSTTDTKRSIFITGLKNAHAFEKQALEMMERQVERYENYPEVERLLRKHIDETHQQRDRIEQILQSMGEEPSTFKDVVTSIMGNMGAITHAMAGDEILKNSFTNVAVEYYEQAMYRSLIAMAEACGQTQSVSLLQQSLREEEQTGMMAIESIREVTLKYLSLEERGMSAGR